MIASSLEEFQRRCYPRVQFYTYVLCVEPLRRVCCESTYEHLNEVSGLAL